MRDLARHLRQGVGARTALRRRLRGRGVRIGSTVRILGDPARIDLGPGVTVEGPSTLAVTDGGGLAGARLHVGAGSYVGEFANIRCGGAPVRIGRDCLIAQHVTIVGSQHRTDPGTLIGAQPWCGTGVTIGNDVWVGAGAILLPDVRVGDGAVIGAGAVVRGHVGPGEIVAGVPARLLHHRTAPTEPPPETDRT